MTTEPEWNIEPTPETKALMAASKAIRDLDHACGRDLPGYTLIGRLASSLRACRAPRAATEHLEWDTQELWLRTTETIDSWVQHHAAAPRDCERYIPHVAPFVAEVRRLLEAK